jgi:hypothetical protein
MSLPAAFGGSTNVVVHPAAAQLDAASEAAHLRSVIEKQPSCLLRVSADGTMLAVSDAAITLLGAGELAQVLNTNLGNMLRADGADVWADFSSRVLSSGLGSAECEMIDLNGTERSTMLLGVALPNHPDGVPSLLVTVRDVSTARRLEASLQQQEGLRQSLEELSAKLATALADRQQFELMAADRDQIQSALESANQAVGNITEERDRLRSRLEEAATERRGLQEALERAVVGREEVQAAAAVRIQQLEAEGADRQRLRAALDEAIAGRQQVAHALEQMVAEHDALEAAARDREAKRQRTLAAHVAARMQSEGALAEANAQVVQLTEALTAVTNAALAARQVLESGVKK